MGGGWWQVCACVARGPDGSWPGLLLDPLLERAFSQRRLTKAFRAWRGESLENGPVPGLDALLEQGRAAFAEPRLAVDSGAFARSLPTTDQRADLSHLAKGASASPWLWVTAAPTRDLDGLTAGWTLARLSPPRSLPGRPPLSLARPHVLDLFRVLGELNAEPANEFQRAEFICAVVKNTDADSWPGLPRLGEAEDLLNTMHKTERARRERGLGQVLVVDFGCEAQDLGELVAWIRTPRFVRWLELLGVRHQMRYFRGPSHWQTTTAFEESRDQPYHRARIAVNEDSGLWDPLEPVRARQSFEQHRRKALAERLRDSDGVHVRYERPGGGFETGRMELVVRGFAPADQWLGSLVGDGAVEVLNHEVFTPPAPRPSAPPWVKDLPSLAVGTVDVEPGAAAAQAVPMPPFTEWDRLLAVAARLGHRFDDLRLARCALTSKSWVNENPGARWPDNKSLEWLGDSVIHRAVTEHLVMQGEPVWATAMSRDLLVSNYQLAQVGESLDLWDALYLGVGERTNNQSEGRSRFIACAVEALLGAAFLDARIAGGDVARVERLTIRLLAL